MPKIQPIKNDLEFERSLSSSYKSKGSIKSDKFLKQDAKEQANEHQQSSPVDIEMIATAKQAAKAIPAGRTGSAISINSVSSANSIQSSGISPGNSKKNTLALPCLIAEGSDINTDTRLIDVAILTIKCTKHDKIAVSNVERIHCVYLPFVQISDTRSWNKTINEYLYTFVCNKDKEEDAKEMIIPNMEINFHNVLRVQLTNERFISRLSIMVSILPTNRFVCCKNTPRINWIRSVDILNFRVDKIWGPEVRALTLAHGYSLKDKGDDIFSSYPLFSVTDSLSKPKSWESKHLKANGISSRTIICAYEDFLEHSYPTLFMCYENFRSYLTKKGFKHDSPLISHFFSAFSYKNSGSYLDFQEVFLGLVAIDPSKVQNTECRGRIIFRYYDSSHSSSMSLYDFSIIFQDISDIINGKGNYDDNELRKRIINCVADIGMRDSRIPLENFLDVLREGKIAGIEKICLAPESIISKMLHYKEKSFSKTSDKSGNTLADQANIKEACARCKDKKYKYCVHQVTLDSFGRLVEPKILDQDWIEECASGDMNLDKHSIELALGGNSFASIIIDMIREFHKQRLTIFTRDRPKGLMAKQEDYSILSKYIDMICGAMLGILNAESKMLKIKSPAIVIGDIHGSLSDLMMIDRHYVHAWPLMPTNIIFLGNYSGVIPLGVECILYLFSMKIATPNKVFLFRGVNETTAENQHFLKPECLRKYGQTLGKKVYERLNKVFERLPFGGVIDENILCVSSGIPRKTRVNKFIKLPKDINQPAKNTPDAYELLVNIPQPVFDYLMDSKSEAKEYIRSGSPLIIKNRSKIKPMINNNGVKISGFTPINGSFTARYTFDQKAFETFMNDHNYTYMIRSNTVVPDDGYDLSFKNRCITIFQCSNYLRYLRRYHEPKSSTKPLSSDVGSFEPTNHCTVVFVDYFLKKIRLIQLPAKGRTMIKSVSESVIESDNEEAII